MKTKLKDQIRDLLSVKDKKLYMLVANKREAGKYDFEGKTYNETEFAELKTKYQNVIVFVHPDCKELNNDTMDLNVMVDSPETAETFLRLREGSKK
jgi:quinolinate synthase